MDGDEFDRVVCWIIIIGVIIQYIAFQREQRRQREALEKEILEDEKADRIREIQLEKEHAAYVASPQYKVDRKREEELAEWKRIRTSGGDCPMCGNNMMVLRRPLPFKDECDKCKYTFTFVYKKINLGKDAWGDTEYGDGIKPTRPKPPKATVKSTGREPIPQDLMDAVWNRDGGQCVKCNSNQDLEYDHMIPLSKGGSNSYKNLQLLCRKCNRSKSDNIG